MPEPIPHKTMERVKRQYQEWELFYAPLLASDDWELALERVKAERHLHTLRYCMVRTPVQWMVAT
jgi:hypothetical protein